MARDFNGTDQELSLGSAILTAAPISVSCWFNADNITANGTIFTISDGGDIQFFALQAQGGAAGDLVRWIVRNKAANTTTGFSAGTWHHACGVEVAPTSRAVYIDGGSKGTNVNNVTPSSVNETRIGRFNPTLGLWFNGRIAELGLWNIALTDAEVAILAKGYSPLLVHPQNLVAYYPIIGRTSPEIDIVGGNNMTVTGAVVAAHTSIIYPTQPISGFAPAAAPPARDLMIISELLKYAPAPILVGGLGLAWVINRRNRLMRGK